MALSPTLVDREQAKFKADADGNTAVRTILSGMTPRVDYDSIEIQYTTTSKEFIDTVTVKLGGSTVYTISVAYPTSSKETYSWA